MAEEPILYLATFPAPSPPRSNPPRFQCIACGDSHPARLEHPTFAREFLAPWWVAAQCPNIERSAS